MSFNKNKIPSVTNIRVKVKYIYRVNMIFNKHKKLSVKIIDSKWKRVNMILNVTISE